MFDNRNRSRIACFSHWWTMTSPEASTSATRASPASNRPTASRTMAAASASPAASSLRRSQSSSICDWRSAMRRGYRPAQYSVPMPDDDDRLDRLHAAIDELTTLLPRATGPTAGLPGRIADALAGIDERLAAVERMGREQFELDQRLTALDAPVAGLSDRLAAIEEAVGRPRPRGVGDVIRDELRRRRPGR